MKNYQTEINDGIKQAFKSGAKERRSVLTMLKAALENEAIALGKKDQGLNEQEFTAVVGREVKKRRQAMEQLQSDPKRVASEEAEIKVLQEFMPKQLSDEEINSIIKTMIDQGLTEVGPVVGRVMAQVKGRAEGNRVRSMVESMLEA